MSLWFLVTACHKPKTILRRPDNPEPYKDLEAPDYIHMKMPEPKLKAFNNWQPYSLPKQFQTKAHLIWEAEKGSFQGPATIRLVRDSAIWMSITPVLGIEAARILALQDSLHILDRLGRKHIARSWESLRNQYPFPISFQWLQTFILRYPFPYNGPENPIIDYNPKDSLLTVKELKDFLYQETVFKKQGQLFSLFRVNKPANDTLLLQWNEPGMIEGHPLSLEPKAQLSALDIENKRRYFGLTLRYLKAEFPSIPMKMGFEIPPHYEKLR